MDAEIERDFEQSINEDWGRERWPDTSSTPHIFLWAKEESPEASRGKRSLKSKKRKTRSS